YVTLTLLLSHTPYTTDIYTLSLHDALPICPEDPEIAAGADQVPLRLIEQLRNRAHAGVQPRGAFRVQRKLVRPELHRTVRVMPLDRKSTRLNSSHLGISYAVFCLKKKMKIH